MTDQVPKTVGRPRKFGSVEELQTLIDAYFKECEEQKRPLTVTGLALALDTTRKSLCEYEEIPEFSNAIKIAKTRVERFAEERLYGTAATGPIFALKNFGWADSVELNHGGQNGKNPIKSDVTLSPADAYRRMVDGGT